MTPSNPMPPSRLLARADARLNPEAPTNDDRIEREHGADYALIRDLAGALRQCAASSAEPQRSTLELLDEHLDQLGNMKHDDECVVCERLNRQPTAEPQPAAEPVAATEIVEHARKALRCLYIATDKEVAASVEAACEQAFTFLLRRAAPPAQAVDEALLRDAALGKVVRNVALGEKQ